MTHIINTEEVRRWVQTSRFLGPLEVALDGPNSASPFSPPSLLQDV